MSLRESALPIMQCQVHMYLHNAFYAVLMHYQIHIERPHNPTKGLYGGYAML